MNRIDRNLPTDLKKDLSILIFLVKIVAWFPLFAVIGDLDTFRMKSTSFDI